MSSLAETYSLQVGVPLDSKGPTVGEAFFPLDHPIEKSILIHAFGGKIHNNQAMFPAKIYEHFAEVVDLLKPVVEPLGYKIFQIGGPGEPPVKGAECLCGKTTILQCVHLVKRAALLIGNDSQWAHMRGSFKGSLVALYGSTSSWVHGPYWKNKDKTILIDSHRFGRKRPSYQVGENPKTINVIPPETVANAALSILDLPQVNRESLFVGSIYNQGMIELVPNVIIDPKVQLNVIPIIRMDYFHDVKNLVGNLQIRKCSVMIDQEIDINVLAQLKGNIASLRVTIDKISPAWIKEIRKIGLPIAFVCLESDEEKVKKMRLDYYDACLFDRFQPPTADDFRASVKEYTQKEFDKELKLDTLRFKVNKFILSEGKVYLSEAHWRAGIATANTETNVGQVIDNQAFWNDKEHYYIFKEPTTT